jgi:hypothetical protein
MFTTEHTGLCFLVFLGPILSCLSSTSHPLITLNLPRRLVAMADALSGKDNIDLLLLLSYDLSPISGLKRIHLKPTTASFALHITGSCPISANLCGPMRRSGGEFRRI